MGGEKKSETTVVNQTTTPQPTAEETALNKLKLEQQQELNPFETRNIKSGLDLSNLLLKGLNLPGYLNTLPGGIDEATTQSIVDQSLKDINPYFAQSNLLDSGVRASAMARTAGDVRRQSATFNLQNLQQLLNLAVGGQAIPVQAATNEGVALGQRLAGLRSVNTSGVSTATSKGPNPFLQSFQTGAGTALGNFVCWVAAEVYEGGWEDIRTIQAQNFFLHKAPKWLLNFYAKFGERTAKFIKDKPMLKSILFRPLFRVFSWLGA